MMKKLNLIAAKARKDKKLRFTSLVHLINEENLAECYKELKRGKALGVDGVSVEEYGKHLVENLSKLIGKMKSGGYRPLPVRRVYIPKVGKDEKRGLGIPAVEDKLVQTMLKKILESIFEADFIEGSYGFRPGRNAHQAVKALDQAVMGKNINYVVEVDIRKFFDEVEHDWMMKCLKERIADPRILELVNKFLKAGIIEEGQYQETEQGTPQGGIISPLLANIYLHYVLDIWFEKKIKPKGRGHMQLIRYCDDFVVCCESKADAEEFLGSLKERLGKFGLRIAEEKTRIVKFGRGEWYLAETQCRKTESFNFLGFTHYGARSRRGKWIMGHKTTKENLRRKLKEITEWLKTIRNKVKLGEWWPILQAKVRGHINYFGISGNFRCVMQFHWRVTHIGFKWLNRRSQKKSMTWEKYRKYLESKPIPEARICFSLYQYK